MYKLLTLIALASASTAAPAATPSLNAAPKAPNAESAQKFCLQMDQVTGSRIRETECRTRADWKLLGVDVNELSAKKDSRDDKAAHS